MTLSTRIKNATKAFKEGEEIKQSDLPQFLSQEPLGDGKAVFLPEMTESEYQDYLENEVNGWQKFKQKIGL